MFIVSPLSPSDSVPSSGFAPSLGQGFHDYNGPDHRRLSNSYSDISSEDYTMGNGFFSDRIGRFPSGHSSSGVQHGRSPDILRSIPPHVTHGFGRDNSGSFDDGHFSSPGDMSMRMSGVDEQLARVGLRAQPSLSMSPDLQTFIRRVAVTTRGHLRLIFVADRTSSHMSVRQTVSGLANGQLLSCPVGLHRNRTGQRKGAHIISIHPTCMFAHL